MKSEQKKLTISRAFTAPVAKVWEAWTNPDIVMRWWGPKNYTAPVVRINFRVGGRYLFSMRSPEGKDYWTTGVYKEIIPLQKIVCTDSFSDETGVIVSGTQYGMENIPLELLITITFKEKYDGTLMILTHEGLQQGEISDMTGRGWNESFDKLARYL